MGNRRDRRPPDSGLRVEEQMTFDNVTAALGYVPGIGATGASIAYVDGKVIDSIADSDTTHAPSRNAVYDALALKLGTTLASGYVWVGNGSNVATAVLLSGDVTITNAGVASLATNQSAAHTWAATQTFTVAPVFTDASGTRTALGLGTAATQNTGTTGATVPLLNGANTHSGASTFTGGLAVSKAAGTAAYVSWQTAGVDRWRFGRNGSAESGLDSGSDLELTALSDAGSSLHLVCSVGRSSGIVNWKYLPTFAGVGLEVYNCGAAGGTADALTCTLTNVPSFFNRSQFLIEAASANATTTPTLALNGGSALTIKKKGGTALAAGDIAGAGHVLHLVYSTTGSNHYELLNPAVSSGTGDVVGPASATDSAVVLFDGTTGKLIKDSTKAYTPTGIGLGNVTNDAQTKAAIVPNTAPSAGQLLVGNAGGTAYAPVSASGDVTVSSTGAHTIANDAVTYAKMQNASANTVIARAANSSGDLSEVALSASQLLGRGSTGDVAAITLGAGLTMSGTTISSTGGVGGVGMSYVGSATVTGAAATTLTISGLDLDTDHTYYCEVVGDNATASNANINLYYNSDTTVTNYNRQSLIANNTTVAGARANDGIAIPILANDNFTSRIWITGAFDSDTRAELVSNYGAGSGIIWRAFAHQWTSTANVTGITLSCSVANSLAVGTYIKVWKVN